MKKSTALGIILIIGALIWNSMSNDFSIDIDGDELEGPLGALIGTLLASGGVVIGLIVTVLVAGLLALVFAGVSILVVFGVGLALLAVVAAVSPLLVPILIPVGIIYLITKRKRARRNASVAA